MTTELARQPSDEQTTEPAPPHPRSDQSRWWKWARRAVAGLTVVGALAGWLVAQTYAMVLLAPLAVAVVSVLQRLLATVQGRLDTGFIANPFDRENTAYLAQFVLRAVLAGLTLASARLAIPRIEMVDLPEPQTQWILVAVPVAVFVVLQLVPSQPISRSLNLLAGIAAVFLAFQLIQIHHQSGAESAIGIRAPFEGEWFVSSGGRSTLINHHYTPLADQRYAIDLVIERDGKTLDGDQNELASYHCWDQPILAPAAGVVVAAENDHQDWPIGQSNPQHAAGNVVVIDIGGDRYVQLAHLRMGSIPVTVGQPVDAGDIVGRCGNSGNTSEPHLHMQLQDSPQSANEHQANPARVELNTFPFRFTNTTHIRGGTEHVDQNSQLRRNDHVQTRRPTP